MRSMLVLNNFRIWLYTFLHLYSYMTAHPVYQNNTQRYGSWCVVVFFFSINPSTRAITMFPDKQNSQQNSLPHSIFLSNLTFLFFYLCSSSSFFFFFLCIGNQRFLLFCCVFLVQQWLWINLIKRWTLRLFRMYIV